MTSRDEKSKNKRREDKRREEKREEEKDQRRDSQKKEHKIQAREEVGKSRNTVFSQWFVALEDQKVASLKRRVRSHPAKWEMKNCICRGAKHISKSKCAEHTNIGPLLQVEMSKKVHAVVARSTFPSQNVNNTPRSDHFWKLRCRKSARRCGAKHISKSKVLKTEHFWELTCQKSAGRCGAKHISKWKVQKSNGYGALFDIRMSFCVAGARDSAPCQKWEKTWGVYSSCNYYHHYTTLHYTTPHYNTLRYTTLHVQLKLQLHYIS